MAYGGIRWTANSIYPLAHSQPLAAVLEKDVADVTSGTSNFYSDKPKGKVSE